MKILFVGSDDWAHLCHRHAVALRAIGHEAKVWTLNQHPFYQPSDSWVGLAEMVQGPAMVFAHDADWIFTSGDGDYRMLRAVLDELGEAGKTKHIGSTHAGTAFRSDPERAAALDREFGSKIQFVGWDSLALGRKYGDDLNFHPYWAPTAWQHSNKIPGEPLRVLHAPTNRLKKGTEQIVEGVRIAKGAGVEIDFRLLEGVSNQKVLDAMLKADVYIDQLMPGPVKGFGVSALEALAAGCVVLADMSTLQGNTFDLVPPIISVGSEEQIANVLGDLAADRSAWQIVNCLWHETHGSFEAVGYRWEKLLKEALVKR